MAARQRFYEILAAASVPESEAVRVHVGLAALLSVSYRFDLALRGLPAVSSSHRKRRTAANDFSDAGLVPETALPTWLPDHLHYNHLLQHAPADLARQLELASATAKMEKPELQVFFGYSGLSFSREQLLDLMALMGQMYPKMMEGLRTFLPGSGVAGEDVRQVVFSG
jgi:hypothetical protein